MRSRLQAAHGPATGRKYRYRGPSAGFWLSAAVVGVVVAGAVALYPRVSLGAPGAALAQVRTTSLGAALTDVRIHWPGGSVGGAVRRGAVLPSGPVPAGRVVALSVRVSAPRWIAWLPDYHTVAVWTIHTPAVPVAQHRTVLRSLSRAMSIAFSGPVAKWRISRGAGFGAWHRGPVRMAPGPAPGERGAFKIQAVSRAWEKTDRTARVAWQTPAYLTASLSRAATLSPDTAIVVQFSQSLAKPNPTAWTVSPSVKGTWQTIGPKAFQFTPSGAGFPPDAHVTITVPGGINGVRSQNRAYLAHTFRGMRAVAPGSVARLQQWLAALGYLPVAWKPGGSSIGANSPRIWQPQSGAFAWRWPALPSALTALWQPGAMTVMTRGALMQFQRTAGLPVTGVANAGTWAALRSAWLHHRTSPDGYTYILASETRPESVELWVNGVEALTTLSNTGIPATPTYLGTYPIYDRLPFQIMRGVNPNGTPYADPVHWINYFRGGDAVHGFVRARYGFPQSLGCVEVPLSVAPAIYHAVHYGTLVTVLPPGAPA